MTYYMNLLQKGSIGAYIALGLVGLAALFILIQSILSYGRGTSRSVFRLLTLGGCALVSLFFTPTIGGIVIPDKAVGEILPIKSEALAPILEASAAEVLLPFLFVAIFFASAILIVIPYKLICGIFGFSYERNNMATRLFAILVGAVNALMIFYIVLLPFFGCMRLYRKAAIEKPDSAAASIYGKYIEDTTESPLYRYAMKYAGDRALNKLSKTEK